MKNKMATTSQPFTDVSRFLGFKVGHCEYSQLRPAVAGVVTQLLKQQ